MSWATGSRLLGEPVAPLSIRWNPIVSELGDPFLPG